MKYCISILCIIFCLQSNPSCSQTISGVVNNYYQVISVKNANNSAALLSAAGLSVGMRVLLIEMKGATPDQTQSANFGDITAINNAGKYEFAEICSIIVDTVYFKNILVNSYDAGAAIQLVTVPQYTNVTVSATLSSSPWDPTTRTGGVLVFEASGTVTLNADIDVSGMGFRGGARVNYPNALYDCTLLTDYNDYYTSIPPSPTKYHTGGTKGEAIADSIAGKNFGMGKLVNAGGGGNNHNSGGGGGSNYGAGGKGGNRSNESPLTCHGTHPGLGGLALGAQGYTVANNRIFLGGGGGVGHANNNENLDGGNGGGIVLIKCSQMIGNSFSVKANGTMTLSTYPDPLSSGGDGASGGGGGGVVILNTSSFSGNISLEAKGGRGNNSSSPVNQCLGPGGGGGGGAVWIGAGSTPGSVAVDISGGANGVVSTTSTIGCGNQTNGATAGSPGNTLYNYVAPEGAPFSCLILPVSNFLRFTARCINDQAALNWLINDPARVQQFRIQRSVDGIHFIDVGSLSAAGGPAYSFEENMGTDERRFYRIAETDRTGVTIYSSITEISRRGLGNRGLQIFPNPARDEIIVRMQSSATLNTELIFIDGLGKVVKQTALRLLPGQNQFNLSIGSLSSGVYYVRTKGLTENLAVRIVKMK